MDFGYAIKLSSQDQKIDEICGTYHSMAPELFNNKKYSFEVDYYALGILAYELTYN